MGDSTVMDFAKPNQVSQLPALKIGTPVNQDDKVLGLGYAANAHKQPYLYVSPGTVLERQCLYDANESVKCLIGESTPRLITRQHVESADSGGPQLNTAGEAVGIVVNKLASRDPSVIPPSAAMSIPIEAVVPYLNKPK